MERFVIHDFSTNSTLYCDGYKNLALKTKQSEGALRNLFARNGYFSIGTSIILPVAFEYNLTTIKKKFAGMIIGSMLGFSYTFGKLNFGHLAGSATGTGSISAALGS